MTLYFVGACIRLYPFNWMSRQKVIGGVWIVLGAVTSVVLVMRTLSDCLVAKVLGQVCSVGESSTLLAVSLGVGVFLFFKNLKVAYSLWINKIASCMFGVLCIHGASDAMRVWLWQDVCCVPEMATASMWTLALHAFGCVFVIMVVCSFVDLARQKWIELPFFKRYFSEGRT